MEMKRSFIRVLSLVFFFLVGLSACGNGTVSEERHQEKHRKNREDWNAVQPGKLVIEPPTLICLGFEWYVEGDVNHNAFVEAWYRKKGESSGQFIAPRSFLRFLSSMLINIGLSGGCPFRSPNELSDPF